MTRRTCAPTWRGHSSSSSWTMSIFTSLNYPWLFRWVQTARALPSALWRPWASLFASSIECPLFCYLRSDSADLAQQVAKRITCDRLRLGSHVSSFIMQSCLYTCSLNAPQKTIIYAPKSSPRFSCLASRHTLLATHIVMKMSLHDIMQNNTVCTAENMFTLQREITQRGVRFLELATKSGC